MIPGVAWSKNEIDNVRPISSFDFYKDEELWEIFSRINTQTFPKEVHQHKGTKNKLLHYRLQFIEKYQLMNIIEKGL